MNKIILISGGIKSGKSNFACSLVNKKEHVYFIATAKPVDKEIKIKIELHQKNRSRNFITIEEPIKIVSLVSQLPKGSNIIIDCVNMWVANMMGKYHDEKDILSEVENLCKQLKKFKMSVLVSNEVGMSLVSTNRLGRKFQELLGKTNQILASYADRVYLMFCGISLRIK